VAVALLCVVLLFEVLVDVKDVVDSVVVVKVKDVVDVRDAVVVKDVRDVVEVRDSVVV